MEATANTQKPTFTKTAHGYNVNFGAHGSLGHVLKNEDGVWVTQHRDGTAGPGAWSRIDAAWALINS